MNPLDIFALGFMTGAAAMGIFALAIRASYQRTLLAHATEGTPERLSDGRFYYLVEEDEYCERLVGTPPPSRRSYYGGA